MTDGLAGKNAPAPTPPDHGRRPHLLIEEYVAAAALIVVVGSVTWGVFTRYVFPQPAIWTSELASIAFAWTVFPAAAAVFRRDQHIQVDLVVAALPSPLRRGFGFVINAAVLVVLVTITVLAFRFTWATMDSPTTVLRLPEAVVYGAAAVGFLAMTLRFVQSLLVKDRDE